MSIFPVPESIRRRWLSQAVCSTQREPGTHRRGQRTRGPNTGFEELERRVLYSVGSDSLLNTDPFGVASSAPSFGTFSSWAPQAQSAGVKWARLFPEWNSIEPTDNTWNWGSVDSIINTAAANNVYVNGMLNYCASWVNSSTHNLPVNNLAAWSDYVSHVVAHCQDSVKYWEVWNEPNAPGFAANGTPANYASTVVAAYDAAKAADPNCQIGLSVASNDVNYLERVIAAGAADHFDYIAVHPYSQLGALEGNFEAEFMSIVPTIRKMLTAMDPAKANCPIWITEMGEQIGHNNGAYTVTETSQAENLTKAVAMSLAQGVSRIEWYEMRDGATSGSDYGFGLSTHSGTARQSLNAYTNLATYLGPNPQYKGWVQLSGTDYGFVFQGATSTVMVAWAPPGASHWVSFGQNVTVMNPLTGSSSVVSGVTLTNSPIMVVGVPASLVSQAQSNAAKPFPWGGNYTNAPSVTWTAGSTNNEQGLHQWYSDATSTYVAGTGRDCSQSSIQYFMVDPNALSYTHREITISVTLRRITAGTNAGFNLKYESTTGFKTASSSWYTIPADTNWHTKTWTITDAEFDGKWAYNFMLDSDSTTYSQYYLQSITVNIHMPPVADSTVRGGTYSNQNFGTDGTLFVKQDAGSDNDRESYLRFDLSAYSSPVTNATLNLPIAGSNSDSTQMTIEVRLVTDDTWSETGITWNNRPTSSTVLATINGSSLVSGGIVHLDLTSIVNSTLAGDKKLSIALVAVNADGTNRWVQFGSRDNTNPLLWPTLDLS